MKRQQWSIVVINTKTKIKPQRIVKALQDCVGHLTLYIENHVGREREIKSETERRKILFHIASAQCSFLTLAGALGTGLFNSCFSLVSLVASESADQPSCRKHCSHVYHQLYHCTWICVTQYFPLGLPFTTQETSLAACHLTPRGSFFALV